MRVSDGAETAITKGDQEVQAFSASADARGLVALIATPTNIGDLFVVDASSDSPGPQRLTSVNDALFRTLDLPAPQPLVVKSFDGTSVDGWYVTPPGFDSTKKYPLILQIHGGPHAAYGYTFTHEFLAQAARGYVVAYMNPRGSTTYGQDFGNVIQFRYPGDDYKDLMAAVDAMVKRGFIDASRLGVTGGSGGGLLTNWVIGHTDRFKAAVSQRSIADWEAWWYAADFTLFLPAGSTRRRGRTEPDFMARSPITYADQIKTPLMLVDGDADYRTPPVAGGEAMFRALKLRHVPVVMVRVPDEATNCRGPAIRGIGSIACATSRTGSTSGCRTSRIPNTTCREHLPHLPHLPHTTHRAHRVDGHRDQPRGILWGVPVHPIPLDPESLIYDRNTAAEFSPTIRSRKGGYRDRPDYLHLRQRPARRLCQPPLWRWRWRWRWETKHPHRDGAGARELVRPPSYVWGLGLENWSTTSISTRSTGRFGALARARPRSISITTPRTTHR